MTGTTLRWLVVVIIPPAEKKLKELGLWDGLEDDLRKKKCIRLYNLPERKRGRKKSDSPKHAIALPLESGEGALLLQPHDKGRNFLVCQGVYSHDVQPVDDGRVFHELSGNVEIRIADWERAEKMARGARAVDCAKLRDEVLGKEKWDPSKGGGPEERKWRAYVTILRDALESQRIDNLPIASFEPKPTTSEWKRAVIVPAIPSDEREALSGKIDRAMDEDFKCRLTLDGEEIPLGRLVKIGQSPARAHRLTFELESGFRKSLVESIRKEVESEPGRFFAALAESAPADGQFPALTRVKSFGAGGNAALKGAPLWDFHLGESSSPPLFSCRARQKDGAFLFAACGLIPRQLFLFADYFGDLYQLDAMERGIGRITAPKRRDIWSVLSGERPSESPREVRCDFPPESNLNEEQKRAVRMALGNRELMLVWGPPGTGKTSVIAEIARQQAERGRKTLIASQANLAVDNALARLWEFESVRPFRIVRTGRDYKLEGEDRKTVPTMKTAGKFFLDRLVKRLEGEAKGRGDDRESGLRRDFLNDLSALRTRCEKGKAGRSDASSRQDEESIDQMRDFHIRRVNVVGATLMVTGRRSLPLVPPAFDTVIVDEVSKALPPEMVLPILRGKSVVLVGDYRQLPPILKDFSEFAERDKSGKTLSYKQWEEHAGVEVRPDEILFERLWERHDDSCRVMLTEQYRMHEDIQGLIDPFYRKDESGLKCGLSRERMNRMTVFPDGIFANKHVAWIDTKRSGEEKSGERGISFTNPDEVRIVGRLLELLPRGRRQNLSVGVITFYGAQLQALRDKYEQRFSGKFCGGVNFGTVDRFQGRECDIIICSLVRNNQRGKVGFASVPNRINVAFSRAKRLLLIVGNSGQFLAREATTEGETAFFTQAYETCKDKGVVCSEEDVKAELEAKPGRRGKRKHAR